MSRISTSTAKVSPVGELDLLFRARFTLVHMVGGEEERALEILKSAAAKGKRDLYCWDPVRGIRTLHGRERRFSTPPGDTTATLELVETFTDRTIFIMLDAGDLWKKQPGLIRRIKILNKQLKTGSTTLVLLTEDGSLPESLIPLAATVYIHPPDYNEMLELIEATLGKARFDELPSRLREKLAKAALGFHSESARNVFAKALLMFGRLDERAISVIIDEKRRLIKHSGILEFFDAEETIDSIGGLSSLKSWLGKREKAFTEEARDYGLPPPKGLLLIGVQGTGKSLTAKAISDLWRLPLLRFDVGKVFGSLVGQSEERMRLALSLAETVSPCLLWVDEIDKSFAGMAGNTMGDSGTSARVFGTMVTWMQEKRSPVFVVATANNVMTLPPELLRKGRFDEIFFIDLPTVSEREEVFRVHLERVRPVIRDYDIGSLAAKCEGFSGAEIEQAIIDAMFNAFDDGRRDFTTEDILQSLDDIVPLSKFMQEQVSRLRQWAEGRARTAT